MTKLVCGVGIVLCGMCTVPLFAGSNEGTSDDAVSSFDELWTKVKSGDTIYVLGTDASETSGTFAKVSQTSIAVLVDGEIHDIPLSDVRQVARRGDRLWNGALIGATFGAVVGLFAADDGCWAGPCTPDAGERAAFALVAGGVYGAIGAGIDALIHGRTVVYRRAKQQNVRLTPVFSGNRAGARLTVGF